MGKKLEDALKRIEEFEENAKLKAYAVHRVHHIEKGYNSCYHLVKL